MNRGRLAGGIICLALAALLGVLYFTLPADQMMFQVEGDNMSWVPAVILGLVGLGLLTSAGTGMRRA